MTLFVYDGENILVDKVIEVSIKNGDDDIYTHMLCDSKLKFPEDGPVFKSTIGGETINCYSLIGSSAPERNMLYYLDLPNPVDINGVYTTSLAFPEKCILGTESQHLFITSSRKLISLKQRYSSVTGKHEVEHLSCDWSRMTKLGCFAFGMCRDFLYDFERNFLNRRMSAIEMMVLGQSKYPYLGTRFDHYNVKTGVVKYDQDLTDRQRDKILNKLRNDMDFSRKDSIRLLNK